MEHIPSAYGLHGRRLGTIALAGVVVFATICILAQFARHDLDWMRAPLSSYLRGEYGWIVKSAYFALGVSLSLLGVGYYQVLAVAARSVAPSLLFVSGGIALDVTALADSGSMLGPNALEALVHNLAAATAFTCVTVAMLLQAWWFRADSAWRNRFAVAFTLAVVCFAALWWYAFWAESLRGLTQKTVIALIVAWLALASVWLRAAVPSRPATGSGHEPRP